MKRRSFLRASSLAPFTVASVNDLSKPKEVIRFGICADLHYDLIPDAAERLDAFVVAMNRQNVDFIIQLGDFCIPKAVNRPIMEVWNKFQKPKYHVIGNHETDGGFSHAQVIDFWNAKGAYYSFDANNYHFVVLNGNEKNPAGTTKGYPRYIGAAQRAWLAEDLASTSLPVIVFCHQGLDNDSGIEHAVLVRRIFEKANEQARTSKVRMVFSGHHHLDYDNEINGIRYVQINSMSYYWAGEKKNTMVYDAELVKKYPHLTSMLRYKDPLWAVATVSSDGRIDISGRNSEFLDLLPEQAGIKEEESIYPVVSTISDRHYKSPNYDLKRKS